MDALPGHEQMTEGRLSLETGEPITQQVCSTCVDRTLFGGFKSADWPCPSARLAAMTERADRAEGGVDGLTDALSDAVLLIHGTRHDSRLPVSACGESFCVAACALVSEARALVVDGLAADLTEAALSSASEQPS